MVNQNLKPTPELLKEVRLFQAFQDNELHQLILLGGMQKCEAYSNIVIEGELSWGIFLILEGTVGVFKNSQMSGTAYDVGQLHQGSFFGEMSLVDQNPRSATVRALTDCQVFYISKDAFNQFLNQSPDRRTRFYDICIQILVSRLRELNDNYVISQYQLWKKALNKSQGEAA